MDREAFKNRMKDLEANKDLNSLKYRGIRIWPFLRLMIYRQELNRYKVPFSKMLSNRWVNLLVLFGIYHLNRITDFFLGSRPGKNRALFLFCHTSNSLQRLNGKVVHRFFDPLKEFKFSTGHNIDLLHLFEFKDTSFALSLKRTFVGMSHTFQKARFMAYYRMFVDKGFDWDNQFENTEILKEVLSSISDNQIKIKDLAVRMEIIYLLSHYLKTFFERVKPTALYHICFYEEKAMAAMLACNQLGIPTVEIQHGQCGNDHPMYHFWTVVPNEGYELMPIHYWTWGEPSGREILKWANRPPYKVFISGNLWLTYFKEKFNGEISKKDELSGLFNGYGKIVMISSNKFERLPGYVIDAIRSPEGSSYFWLIRLHPGMKNYELEVEYLNEALSGCENYDLSINPSIGSLEVIQLIDIHVTTGSSLAQESQVFGVDTIVVSDYGKRSFSNQITEGVVLFAGTSIELLEHLSTGQFLPEETPFMVLDKDLVRQPQALR